MWSSHSTTAPRLKTYPACFMPAGNRWALPFWSPVFKYRWKGVTTARTSSWQTPSSSMARTFKLPPTFKLASLQWSSRNRRAAEAGAAGSEIYSSNRPMAQQQQEMAAAQAKIAANKAAIAAVNKRFGELADYNIWDEVTVYFGNDKVTVDPQYDAQLMALCQKAKTVNGYVIQVKGYASAVGSAALNQKLSQERAANVTDFLDQQCRHSADQCSGSRRDGHQQAGSS